MMGWHLDRRGEIRLRNVEPLHARKCRQLTERKERLRAGFMTIRLHLYRIRVIEVLTDLPERLEVAIRDLRSVVRCPWCGFKTTNVHETRRVKVKDLDVSGRRMTLVWLRRRFACTNCGEHVGTVTSRSSPTATPARSQES